MKIQQIFQKIIADQRKGIKLKNRFLNWLTELLGLDLEQNFADMILSQNH